MRLATTVALLVLLMPSLIFAAEPQFGWWAKDLQFCNDSGDTHRNAPLIVTATTLNWATHFCDIGKMYKANRGLYIEGRCSNGTRHPISLVMKGDRLVVAWNGDAPQEMRRCP